MGIGVFSLSLLAVFFMAAGAQATAITWVGDDTTNTWDTTSTLWDSNDDNVADTTYTNGDPVTFDNDGSTSPWTVLSGSLSPGSVTLNVTSAFYLITCGGSTSANYITGTTGIDKYGTGKVHLNWGTTTSTEDPLGFSGDVNVYAGILAVDRPGSLGNATGITRVHDGATLDIIGTVCSAETIYVQGAGVGGLGALYNGLNARLDPEHSSYRYDQSNAFKNVTLEGDTTVGGVAGITIIGGTLTASDGSGGGYDLTVKMTGKDLVPEDANCDWLSLNNMVVTDLGNVYVERGVFSVVRSSLGITTDSVVIGTGIPGQDATLRMYQLNPTDWSTGGSITKNIVANGGGILVSNNAHDNYWYGSVTLDYDMPVDIDAGESLSLYNNAGGQGVIGVAGITKLGGGTLTLEGTNTYGGDTTIETGTLALGTSATLSGTASIEVQVDALFDVSAGGFTLGSTQTLMGGGTVTGDVVVEGTLAAGSSVGQLTLTGAVDLSAGGMTWELATLTDDADGVAGTDFDQLVVGGDLSLGGTSELSLDLTAVGDPSSSEPFWAVEHTWTVIDGTSNTGDESFAGIAGGPYAAGSFSTSLGSGEAAGDVLLHYTPIPEPSTVVLLAGLALVGWMVRRR